MKDTLELHNSLVEIYGQHENWMDVRHLKTLVWMVVGLIQSGLISLAAWAPFVQSRAVYCQSVVRRFERWLDNERIDVYALYGPLIAEALAQWGDGSIYLALDTSMLWNEYCVIRISIIYRGRAVPLVWEVIEHASSQVAYGNYKTLLNMAASLLPPGCKVVFLADRGFADTHLMEQLKKLGWHWRIRIKGSFWIYRKGHDRIKVGRISVAAGQAIFRHGISITKKQYGPVHLALAKRQDAKESWIVLSDEPTDTATFEEYGFRFDIEENFLDDKSNGFQLESSSIRSAGALTRLCFVLAMTTLYLVCQGVEVVKQGKRRFVDPHWFRGSSYLKIGWNWVKLAITKGYDCIEKLLLPGDPDPEPAMASKKDAIKRQSRFVFEVQTST